MRELETRIGQWKRSVAVAFGESGEVLEELESHLREEIDRLTQAGHAPEAALAAAQMKLGRPVDLAAEYARAVPPARWLPIPVGLALLVLLFGYLTWLFVVPGFFQGGDGLLRLHVTVLMAGYALGFYTGLLGICYVVCWLVRPIGLGQRRSLERALFVANLGAASLLLLGIMLGGLWASDTRGRAWNNDPREIGTLLVSLWFAALAAMLWAVPQKQHRWVLLNVLATGVVAGGWFAPALFPQDNMRTYGAGITLLSVVVAFTTVPLAIALLGLMSPGRLRRQPT